jgi:hypothetical protein
MALKLKKKQVTNIQIILNALNNGNVLERLIEFEGLCFILVGNDL